MNLQNFNQSGGFPLQTETLDHMQTAYKLFNKLGDLAGSLCIVSGCVVTGSVVSDGAVVIAGELLEFRGGNISTSVIIVQEVIQQEFEDATSKDVVFIRYATFGVATSFYLWADFKRPKTNVELTEGKAEASSLVAITNRLNELEAKTAVFQAGGGMIFWNKPLADIPGGWAEVADWRGRIAVGLDTTQTEFNLMGKQGGAKSVTLTEANTPIHDHYIFKNTSKNINSNRLSDYPDRTATARGFGEGSADHDYTIASDSDVADLGKTSKAGNVTPTAVQILNPYRVALFIEWVGL